jgi:gas vesicle protein
MVEDVKGINWSAFFIGTAIGGILGAAAGVLFAPQDGQHTRKQIGDWLDARREKGSELLARVKEQSQHKKEQVLAALKAGQHAYAEVASNGGVRV